MRRETIHQNEENINIVNAQSILNTHRRLPLIFSSSFNFLFFASLFLTISFSFALSQITAKSCLRTHAHTPSCQNEAARSWRLQEVNCLKTFVIYLPLSLFVQESSGIASYLHFLEVLILLLNVL